MPVDPAATGQQQHPRPVPLNSPPPYQRHKAVVAGRGDEAVSPLPLMAASPAASRRQSTTTSSWRSGELQGGGAGAHGHRPSYDRGGQLSSSSSYSARSSQSQVSRSGSVKAAARRFAGAFTSCFAPRVQVKTEEEEEVKSRAAECHVSIDSGILCSSSSVGCFLMLTFVDYIVELGLCRDEMKQTCLIKFITPSKH